MLRFHRFLKFQQLNLFVCSTQKSKKFSILIPIMELDSMTLWKAFSKIGQSGTDIEFQQSTIFAMKSI